MSATCIHDVELRTSCEDCQLKAEEEGTDIHTWFGLTYANYMVLPRSLLQSMPIAWQVQFVKLLQEMQLHFWDTEEAYVYTVQARDASGKFVKDPIPHYNRGRTFIPGGEVSA